jgi:hypothetical protein
MSIALPPKQEQRDQAGRLGRMAGRARKPATECPYAAAGTPTERVLAAVWVRGYLKANPAAAKKVSYDS